jgi:hypothetical protein
MLPLSREFEIFKDVFKNDVNKVFHNLVCNKGINLRLGLKSRVLSFLPVRMSFDFLPNRS